MNKHNILNEIYEPLHKKVKSIYKEVVDNGYKASIGWYNMHSVKYNDDFLTEFFPIPIITIESIGDIGLNIDSIFFETTISREKALEVDYASLIEKYSIEVYGADDYLTDFYNKNMLLSDIKTRIQGSKETQICIALYFDMNIETNILLEIISVFI
ncbi:DUF3201 domain-containing protein [Abyssisolibacter fermentans]|uniref:DUF3201 domain-containing protein n=1 Tax=Abyssisolibacter fermentans TaxID=1766203 RepID=UPI001FA7691B|nr:DUF3201 domain-containing protein [Abyssisolibacter fermentans]